MPFKGISYAWLLAHICAAPASANKAIECTEPTTECSDISDKE